MSSEYYQFGEKLPDLHSSRLTHDVSRQLLHACQQSDAFQVLELRKVESNNPAETESTIDAIVVECCDGTVPSRNQVGIRNNETLLLLYCPALPMPHEVWATRTDFPVTPHQNHAPPGHPPSLCLYFEPWSVTERTWTAQRHLQRILWWLRETALGRLHRSDQPIERLYFVPSHHVVLPSNFIDRVSNQQDVFNLARASSRKQTKVLRGFFEPVNKSQQDLDDQGLDTLVVSVPPAYVTSIHKFPSTLGELDDQLKANGSSLVTELRNAAIKAVPAGTGLIIHTPKVKHTLLLLQVPVVRTPNTPPERTDVIGFIVHNTNLPSLAIACDAAFDGTDGNAYVCHGSFSKAVGEVRPESEEWRALSIEPAEVRLALNTSQTRTASGIPEEGAALKGVIAGVGALGSQLADIWSRGGWGNWTYIDDDVVFPHNLVRHLAKDWQIGWAKVDAVAQLVTETWPDAPKPGTVFAKATDFKNEEVKKAISSAQLIVDATTTLELPRDLSHVDWSPRIASTFFTPTGRDSVLLMEDSSRTIRLHSIEAQYYRAIINSSSWGESHLTGHRGNILVGGGCRDISGVLPQEIVQIHSATMARQIRLLSANQAAQIRVWSLDEDTGALVSYTVPVAVPIEQDLGEWSVIWDEELNSKIKSIRSQQLPHETGGVILGYADHKAKTIHVVDVATAPTDSISSPEEFTRGAEGVREVVERAGQLTANIVGYLGEWHSHPRNCSATPSRMDIKLLSSLASTLAMDGQPALMMIVGEHETSISLMGERIV